MLESKYLSVDPKLISSLKADISFLVITATDIEKESLHEQLSPMLGEESILVVVSKACTYYIGILGLYTICHVQTRMGSISAGASSVTTMQAITDWGERPIIMIGIAFGINKKKQKIGDVLVSESISSYEPKKVGKLVIEQRGGIQQASSTLLDRFRNVLNWNFKLPDDSISKLIIGQVLSGEVLVDNKEYRDAFKLTFPTAIGGEMEGAGLSAVAHTNRVEWIVVKAICDFADGFKSRNKDQNQIIAAKSAVSLCCAVLSNQFGFESLNCKPTYTANHSIVANDEIKIDFRKILFTLYQPELDKYYYAREHDSTLQGIISYHTAIWIHGVSGVGKTTSVFRNLAILDKSYVVIDLSNYINYDICEIFNNLALVLCKKLTDTEYEYRLSFVDISRYITSLLGSHISSEIMIVFEELPVNNNESFVDLISHITSFIISHNNSNPNSKIKFIFTSIDNPTKSIPASKIKALEHIKVIKMNTWNYFDLNGLVDLVTKFLSISINPEDKLKLVSNSHNIPRFIKRALLNTLAQGPNTNLDISFILSTTAQDLGLNEK